VTDAVDRVRKILRLARDRGASEHEAASAMEMASRIMLEHGLTDSDVEEPEELAFQSRPLAADETWKILVGSCCGALHACRVLRAASEEGRTVVMFLGRRTNVETAEETHEFLVDQIQRSYEEKVRELQWARTPRPPDFEETFKDAMAMKLIDRAWRIVEANRLEIPPERALVLIDGSLAAADEVLRRTNVPSREAPSASRGSGTGVGWMEGDRLRMRPSVTKG
jgi:hypothetical protein